MKPSPNLRAVAFLAVWASVAAVGGEASTAVASQRNPFFAMDTGTHDAAHPTAESQVRMLKALGYAGIGPTYDDLGSLREMETAVDRYGLKLFALYAVIDIDAGKSSADSKLREAIFTLKGRETILWLDLQSKKYKPSATEGDAAAVEILRGLAGIANHAKIRIALYPHAGHWTERIEDVVRLAKKVDRKNLGVTFNLCHWLRVDGKDLEEKLSLAKPYLFVVTINGADKDRREWNLLIQTLDKGTFDNQHLLSLLAGMGYTGPIGLQHYGIGGSAEENLKRSIDAWRNLSADAVVNQAN